MKRALYAAIGALALASHTAGAADIPARAPAYTAPVQAPIFNWSGLYVGGHLGGGWAESDWTYSNDSFWNDSPGDKIGFRPDGWLGGAQVGLNYQFGQWLAGIEGTFSWADLSETVASPFFPNDRERTQIKSLYTVTARLGAIWDRSLWYVKGGWAGGRVALSAVSTFGEGVRWDPGARTRSGWIIGAGVEYMPVSNWIMGIEYNYIDLGSENYVAFNTGDSTTLTSVNDSTKVHTVVVRLSYLFATGKAPAPVVTRY